MCPRLKWHVAVKGRVRQWEKPRSGDQTDWTTYPSSSISLINVSVPQFAPLHHRDNNNASLVGIVGGWHCAQHCNIQTQGRLLKETRPVYSTRNFLSTYYIQGALQTFSYLIFTSALEYPQVFIILLQMGKWSTNESYNQGDLSYYPYIL